MRVSPPGYGYILSMGGQTTATIYLLRLRTTYRREEEGNNNTETSWKAYKHVRLCANALTTLSCWGCKALYPSFTVALNSVVVTSLSENAAICLASGNNPLAPSNKNLTPAACYNRKHEREKKRAYDQRIREVEHSSFSPLVFSATGGMGREATCFYKRLASMLAHKWDQPYSTTLWWLRCRLTFSLIRSAIQALRGARSSQGHAFHSPTSVDLVISESGIAHDS